MLVGVGGGKIDIFSPYWTLVATVTLGNTSVRNRWAEVIPGSNNSASPVDNLSKVLFMVFNFYNNNYSI
jgi:hypothetical protein